MSAPQELLKQYVQSQHFTSTADIMAAMKDMFRDVIQQVMEVEMDEELGRERCQRSASEAPNYRNGYSQKTVKTQLGEIDIKVPRDRKGNYEPKIISKYDRNAEGMEDKILSLYACGMSQRDIAEQSVGCCTWHLSGSSSIGTPGARIGTWCSASWRLCSPTAGQADPLEIVFPAERAGIHAARGAHTVPPCREKIDQGE